MHDKARVAALQKAIEQERLEDIRRAERFRELADKVRAFRDGGGKAPTEAELTEWAEHSAKPAAVAERLAELPGQPAGTSGALAPENSVPPSFQPTSPPSLPPEFADTATLDSPDTSDSQRSPEVEWMETFAYALLELETESGRGNGDIDALMSLAAELWPLQGQQDAIEVAQQAFKEAGKG